MMLFPKALFLVTTFPKIVKNSIFLLNFYQKFLKVSQQFVYFVQTRENLTHGLLNFCEKYAKIMHLSNFHKKFFENFRTLSDVRGGGLRPRTPHEADPRMYSSRTKILATPLELYNLNGRKRLL